MVLGDFCFHKDELRLCQKPSVVCMCENCQSSGVALI